MSKINAELIGLIREILARNDELMQSNEDNLRVFNEMVLDFDPYLAKFEAIPELSQANQEDHNKVFERASANTHFLEEVFASADKNRSALSELRSVIDKQRDKIGRPMDAN